jgi:hypothetical protein
MAKEQAVKAKSDEAQEASTVAAEAGKPANTSLTKAAAPTAVKPSEGNGSKAASGDRTNVTVQLYSTSGAPLQWGAENGVESVTAIVGELCGGDGQTCGQTFTSRSDSSSKGYVQFSLSIPPMKMVRIDLAVQYKNAAAPALCKPTITMVDCEEQRKIDLEVPPQAITPPKATTTTLILEGHWCSNKDVRHDRRGTVEIASASAKLLWMTGKKGVDQPPAKNPTIQATLQSGAALLLLQSGGTYEITFALKEKFARSCPGMPFVFDVGWTGEKTLPICVEPCERVVALFFVNSCGQPAVPADVFRDNDVHAMTINEAGVCSFNAAKVGRVRLSSRNYELRPTEIEVDERMAQAHVIEALPRTLALAGAANFEEIVLEFAEEIRQGERAFFRIMTLEGKLIETLEAGSGKAVYCPPTDEPLMIHALRNGKVIDEVMHHVPK